MATRTRRRASSSAPSAPGFTELENLLGEINKEYGEGTMQKASALTGLRHIETGIFTLDFALLGGVPQGFVSMLYGFESSGKSTVAMRIAANAQKKFPGRAVVYLDCEGTYDNSWASQHGVDNDKLFYASPASGEEAVNIAQGVMTTEETAVLIVDSLPAMVPQKEGDAASEDDFYALRARLIAKLCSKVLYCKNLLRAQGKQPATVIFVNQWRTKLGMVMGDPRTLPGGNQPKYLASAMIELKNKEVPGKSSDGIDIVTHNDHSFVIKKSKAGNSIRTGSFKMIRDPEHELGAGSIDEAPAVLAFSKKMGLYTGGGTAYYLASMADHRFQNGARAIEFLNENPDELMRAKQLLLMRQRHSMGIPMVPADGYLLQQGIDDDLIALAQA